MAMSQRPVSQPQQNGAIDGNFPDNANGLQNDFDNGTQRSPSSTSFDMLHDKLRSEVDKLEGGLESAKEAASKLAKTFREQGDMIQSVQARFGKDQDLEREIRELKAGNKEMWRLRDEDTEQLKSRISELEEDAEAVQKQKQKYEWQTFKLKDEYQKKEQSMKREYEEMKQRAQEELEQGKARLEAENATRIAEYEAQLLALRNANQQLKEELRDKAKELENEKAISQRMQASLYEKVNHFEGALKQIETKYAVEERSLEY
jgi:chromosome segregation ATPase